ncbi:UNVERIFIED_CONTAM: hypothetical protein PYX00_003638 [Menopon gallinae]|uniref:Transmembrane protein n=1 Tax=Menopon gallinae TaxID=328185 RepID=A0AAW2I158_9NEOP
MPDAGALRDKGRTAKRGKSSHGRRVRRPEDSANRPGAVSTAHPTRGILFRIVVDLLLPSYLIFYFDIHPHPPTPPESPHHHEIETKIQSEKKTNLFIIQLISFFTTIVSVPFLFVNNEDKKKTTFRIIYFIYCAFLLCFFFKIRNSGVFHL